MNNINKTILCSFLYSFITLFVTFRFIGLPWYGYCIAAGVILFVGICVCICYYYEKLTEKLEKLEKQLNGEDKADENATTQNQTPKD